MKDTEYSMHRTLPGVTFDEAIEVVTDALKEEGFGVLTKIDVAETLKTKIGADFRPYVILGACNPVLANQALSADDNIGLMLPCNVVVAVRRRRCRGGVRPAARHDGHRRRPRDPGRGRPGPGEARASSRSGRGSIRRRGGVSGPQRVGAGLYRPQNRAVHQVHRQAIR